MKKNTLKVLTLGVMTLLCAAMLPRMAGALDLSDAQTAEFNKTANASNKIGGANLNTAANLLFTGYAQAGTPAASTGAYVTISASAMTFYQPYLTVDTSMGTAGVVTFASTLASNTMGALCDYINTRGKKYVCTLVDAKRDDVPGVWLKTQTETDGTNNLQAVGGFNVLQTTTSVVSLGIIPAPGLRVVLKRCSSNGMSVASDLGAYLTVYGEKRKNASGHDRFGAVTDDTTSVWQTTTTNNTTAFYPHQYATGPWIEFAPDQHVVVRQGLSVAGTGGVQTSANFVECSWDEK